MSHDKKTLRGAVAVGAFVAAFAVTQMPAQADNFTLRIAAGHPSAPLASVNQLNKTFVPNVTKRVAEETDHTVRFIEGYGGTIANLFEVLESTQKGLVDIGAMCSCFEPTKLFVHNLNYFNPFISGDPKIMGPTTRQVHKEFDYFYKVFSDNYNQTYIANGAFDDYGLGTKFPWTKMSELKGVKIGAAGPNLPWLDYAGAAKVQTNLNEVYNALQSGVYDGIVIFPAPYFGFKFGEVAKYYTTMGWGSVVAYPVTVNNDTWAKLPDSVKKIIMEETEVYNVAVEDEGVAKFTSALENLKKQGVTVRDLGDEERGVMARAIEPWVQQKAQEYEDQGFPGKATFKRLMELSKENGAKPVHEYAIN
ncbi:MAG: C4-dicarboxylate TRAP transporter substrate-binding protein [Alphaproteobacteria bacterium]|nr:C4-dicarboxylate TRAP transporter substrate-binding protein [Alphaproteobacteria bacterium]